MQIVIDISENNYNQIKSTDSFYLSAEERLIKNGLPLPKGHGDLKDQKDLAKSLQDYKWVDQLTYIEVTSRLISTPTIIEAGKAESEPQESEEV